MTPQNSDISMNSNPPPEPKNTRIVSVDALRGFDMFWIVGGDRAVKALLCLFVSPLPKWIDVHFKHADWEGFTAWDMIMPLFLFIVGTAMPLSFARRIEAGQSKAALYKKILLRVVILFVLGMVAQGRLLQADLSKLHIYCNTLQAIAAGYLIASIVMLHLGVRRQVAAAAALLIGYWLLMLLVPIPGRGAGLYEENANLALYVDELILGRFRDGTTYTWILSGMAFGATVLLGVFSGHVLRAGISPAKKVISFLAMGVICLGLGWLWSRNFLGSFRCPIIKHLFTSSMVLWSCGFSYLLLALFYLVIDVLNFRRWAFPFIVIGSNAILAYIAVHLVNFQQLANTLVGGAASNLAASQSDFLKNLGSALTPLAAFAILWGILFYLYRKRTFVRI
jgi:predicted acyltransferase